MLQEGNMSFGTSQTFVRESVRREVRRLFGFLRRREKGGRTTQVAGRKTSFKGFRGKGVQNSRT